VINPDASFVEERSGALKVLKKAAVEGAKRFSISYSTSMQTAGLIEAYTRKPDGRRIDVPKDNCQVRANSGRGSDAPVISDRTAKWRRLAQHARSIRQPRGLVRRDRTGRHCRAGAAANGDRRGQERPSKATRPGAVHDSR
jgi:hypothetical protein